MKLSYLFCLAMLNIISNKKLISNIDPKKKCYVLELKEWDEENKSCG